MSAPRPGREYPDRPWVGIGAIVFRGEEVLLVRRGRPPRQGQWSLPGGAQRLGESAEAAARREVLEETGIETGPLLLAAVVDGITRDAAGAVRFHYTIIDYCGRWSAGEARAADDVTEVAWVRPDALAGYDLTPEALDVIARARGLLAAA